MMLLFMKSVCMCHCCQMGQSDLLFRGSEGPERIHWRRKVVLARNVVLLLSGRGGGCGRCRRCGGCGCGSGSD